MGVQFVVGIWRGREVVGDVWRFVSALACEFPLFFPLFPLSLDLWRVG
jgi:hypothetical protein